MKFYTEIYHRNVPLCSPTDIAQCSFIVQHSISHLDLALSKSDIFLSRSWNGSEYAGFCYLKDFINTEEGCRKCLTPRRKLLYTLHLDLPREREIHLRNRLVDPKNVSWDFRIPHIGKISISNNWYINKLCHFLEHAWNNVQNKVKLLSWFLNFNGLSHELRFKSTKTVTYFIDCLDPGIKDLEFIKKGFTKLDFTRWLLLSPEKPGRVKKLLYTVNRIGRKSCSLWINHFLRICLLHESFMYVKEILQFINYPVFNNQFCHFLLAIFGMSESVQKKLEEILNSKSIRRRSLLIHLYWNYRMQALQAPGHLNTAFNFSAARESLRLVWNSVPDNFISFEEMQAVFKDVVGPESVVDLYNFYSNVVQEFHSVDEPRSLEHYCRITIRRTLWENERWLPEGIRKIGLPRKLESFLNLDY
ncbi:hypothetical protein HNY73_015077 [Argiope bruennichi]|uniref:SOCS box domain-containing protein n=1 Tax=Argiope bruennichi TaxID=94029 RepID=A0A8T0EVD7_ARGBR|nr:hypothetical protein HNY73_015077 [Argiope bruennichi]